MLSESTNALMKAVEEDASIYELELVGVPDRVLSILDNNGVFLLKDLLKMSPTELSSLPHIGPKAANLLIMGLREFHLVEDISVQRNSDLQTAIKNCDDLYRNGVLKPKEDGEIDGSDSQDCGSIGAEGDFAEDD